MAELETAEEFADRMVSDVVESCERGDCIDVESIVEAIEADRKAVALRVLDELIAIVNVFPLDTDDVRLARYRAAYSVLRAKYQEKP